MLKPEKFDVETFKPSGITVVFNSNRQVKKVLCR